MGFGCSGCDMLGHCRSRMVILLAGSLLGLTHYCVCVVVLFSACKSYPKCENV